MSTRRKQKTSSRRTIEGVRQGWRRIWGGKQYAHVSSNEQSCQIPCFENDDVNLFNPDGSNVVLGEIVRVKNPPGYIPLDSRVWNFWIRPGMSFEQTLSREWLISTERGSLHIWSFACCMIIIPFVLSQEGDFVVDERQNEFVTCWTLFSK